MGLEIPSGRGLSDSHSGYPSHGSVDLMLLNQGSLQQRWCMQEAGGGGRATEGERGAASTDMGSKWQRPIGLGSRLKKLRRCGNRCCRLDLSMAVSGVGWLQINNQHPAVAVNQGLNL